MLVKRNSDIDTEHKKRENILRYFPKLLRSPYGIRTRVTRMKTWRPNP